MKRLLGVTLGILTAIGGFVDIGDLVASALVGARFGMALLWATVLGVFVICLYAEMCGRVAAVAGRPVFDLIRERLGPKAALANLAASLFVTLLTMMAEIAGVALAIELATSVNYLLWVPVVAFLVWLVVWRVQFERMEQGFGLAGLALVALSVAVWKLGPDWGQLFDQATAPTVPTGEGHPTYLYYAVALFGSAVAPYEVFFFSSGGVEEHWNRKDLITARMNVFVGFPLGGLLVASVMALVAIVYFPVGVQVDSLAQVALPAALALGKLGLAFVILGIFAATFGAALETSLSAGYTVAQFFGWQWGKYVRPREASRFHVVMLVSIVVGAAVILTTVDPIKVTEYSLVFSAAALPLTYLPILVIANDPDYMGDKVNGRLMNAMSMFGLAVILVASAAAIPLMLATKAGL